MIFWHVCKACNGRGTVAPNSPHARVPPDMTGELIDFSVSVCGKCHGSGKKWKSLLTPATKEESDAYRVSIGAQPEVV